MKKLLRQKIPKLRTQKLRSKKGLSLVELIVGITILVIIFTATLSAMTNGYTTTLFNADVNKKAVEGGSLNEILMQTLQKQEFYNEADFTSRFYGGTSTPAGEAGLAVDAAAKAKYDNIAFVPPSDFPRTGEEYENQYTVISNGTSNVKKGTKTYAIRGITVITSLDSVKGPVINTSFIPYTSQTP